jgi:hypothetical protein
MVLNICFIFQLKSRIPTVKSCQQPTFLSNSPTFSSPPAQNLLKHSQKINETPSKFTKTLGKTLNPRRKTSENSQENTTKQKKNPLARNAI